MKTKLLNIIRDENVHLVQNVKKGDAILIPGKDANEFHYMPSGAFKLYHHDEEGEEVLQHIWVDDSFILLPEDYIEGNRNNIYHIKAIEDSTLLTLTKPQMDKLCVEYPVATVYMNRIRTQMRDFTHLHVQMLNMKQNLRYAFYVKHFPLVFRKSLTAKDVMAFLGICQKTLTTAKREMVLRDRRFR